MNITLIFFGSKSPDYHSLYQKEINKIKQFKYNIKLLQLGEDKNSNLELKKKKETLAIIEKIPKNAQTFLFSERGKLISSMDFSTTLNHANICYIIGGSEGVDEDLIRQLRPDIIFLSLGKIVFPHKIFKLIVLEQIYRGLTIKYNRKYHRGS
ncbi:Ribosomal RNA large subunit methyltransferase H [Mesomycoplasma conjunctivae]|uniref:Ribosomal RNA large subunit methyltransferase H n=1 Tax=Mesomycoplasma conjunctivae (strain ATCC 25834 / NCTC 10147 / HRC/581) TaxID=572263 RepID=C5J5G2_MESCH|nr:23S rRNA (pseudouridine(1915)-N(3))-methyltransferase RlmH [Mesomycoplasma conjunctivae]CAT04684.1 UPF0247 protein MHJ_0004 [Mesomycoplasma conjunctivae]VEU65650.1 Ribosomal RNA large subunit methyltransferase H [Mesomycoplasma conjunctivae]